MAHDLSRASLDDFGSLAINDLIPERPLIIGEFSSSYETFRDEMLKDLAPVTKYEFIQALQLVDLNWAIMQLKASANAELSSGTERFIRHELERALQAQAKGKYGSLLEIFVENGGDAEEFEAPIDLAEIEVRVDSIVRALKSENYSTRVAASNEALDIGISPQLVFSDQLLNNQNYLGHTEKLPDLEKRVRQMSVEYRELQMSRPVDISPVSGD